MGALVAKRLIVSTDLRAAFARLWIPILASPTCCQCECTPAAPSPASSAPSPSWQPGEPRFFLCGVELNSEERAIVLFGFNELLLTLPAPEQQTIYSHWAGHPMLTGAHSHACPPPHSLPHSLSRPHSHSDSQSPSVPLASSTRGIVLALAPSAPLPCLNPRALRMHRGQGSLGCTWGAPGGAGSVSWQGAAGAYLGAFNSRGCSPRFRCPSGVSKRLLRVP